MRHRPPMAPRVPHTSTCHGDTREDPYHWMRRRDDPRVLRHLRAENAFTATVLRPLEGVVEGLYREMKRRHRASDRGVPERVGAYYHYSRTPRGLAYPVHCRRRDALGAREEVLLDENALAARRAAPHLHLGALAVSPDHRLVALTADFCGDERYALLVLDPTDPEGDPLLEVPGCAPGLAWAGDDSRTLVYTTLGPTGRPEAAHRRRLGDTPEPRPLYHEPDEGFFVSCRRSRSGRFVFITASNNITDEVRLLDTGAPEAPLRLLRPRRAGVKAAVAHQGRWLYVVTNEDAPNFKVMRAPLADPGAWQPYIAHREDTLIEGIEAFAHHLVVVERRLGLLRLRVVDIVHRRRHVVQFGEPSHAICVSDNPEYDTGLLRFTYSSPLTPTTIYDYDMSTRFKRPRRVDEVDPGFDPGNYRLERTAATAPDGARVPITLLYRRGLRRDGKNPLYLYGYGSYGFNASPEFSAERFSLVDRGFVFAIAHVRGGQELGNAWYEDGKLLRKRNTFSDFIACTEHLIERRFTAAGRVVASGVSAGGMLVAAVINMRPELYRAAVMHVPFVDVLNSMLDREQTLTVFEYDEWGDPNQEQYYRYIKSYSPYDNIGRQAYPHILVLSSYNDTRVPYWEATKYVARLRAERTDHSTMVLLKTFMSAGHAGKSGRFEALRESALETAFVFLAFGQTPTLGDPDSSRDASP